MDVQFVLTKREGAQGLREWYSCTKSDSVSRDWLRGRSIYWLGEQRQSKNPKQSLRFCTAEESRLNKSLELQTRKGLRRENEEEGRRLDPRGWEGGTWESTDNKESGLQQESATINGLSYWIFSVPNFRLHGAALLPQFVTTIWERRVTSITKVKSNNTLTEGPSAK